MKLLVIDHNALDPSNRGVYAKLAGYGDITLRLVVPERWFNNYSLLRFQEEEHDAPYQLRVCPVVFPTRTHRMMYRSLRYHRDEFRPDVLYINAEPENAQTLQAALLSSRRGMKLVFSSWRNIDHKAVGYPYKLPFLNTAAESYVLGRAAHGIVFNQTAQTIFARNNFSRTTCIPPCVDTTRFRPVASEVKEKFTVGYVGRLSEHKGVDLLLRAIASMPRTVESIIVGTGPAKETLTRLAAELAIADRVTFLNPVPADAVPSTFARMDVLVLPSRTSEQWKEQFGRVLIEAMACGVPVIGSTSGEIPWVIGDAGILFKEESIEGLKLGIEHLLQSDRLRADMRERGLRRVQKMFSLDVVALQHHTLFTSLWYR